MVGVGDGLLGDLEGQVKVHTALVYQDAHELGAAHGWVRVVGVDGHVVGEVLPVGAKVALVGAEDGLQASGDKQVLLLQAQNLAVLAGVVGIEDRRDGLDVGAELVRLGVVSGVERVEVEVLLVGLGAPEAQTVDLLGAIANDGHVVRDGAHLLAALLGEPVATSLVLVAHDLAAKLDNHRVGVAAGLPGEAVLKPVVGLLDLATTLDDLAEQAVVVAHAVAIASNALVSHRVEEARGETPKATVAQAGVCLLAADGLEGAAHVLHALGDKVVDAKVEKIVVKQRTKEELEGEVIDLLLAPLVRCHGNVTRLLRDERRQHLVALELSAVLELLAEVCHAGLAILLLEICGVLEDLFLCHVTPMSCPAGRNAPTLHGNVPVSLYGRIRHARVA